MNILITKQFFRIFLVLVSGGILLPVAAQQQALLPLRPAELIKYLPAAPLQWKLVSSTASDSFSSWIVTVATRQFELSPAALSPSSVDAATGAISHPATTRVRITDGGFSAETSVMFRNFAPGTKGGVKNYYFQTYPAILASSGQGTEVPRERLLVLVKQRFIIEIATTYQRPGDAEKWLKQIDLRKLAAVSPTGLTKIPNPVFMSSVDELKPTSNGAYPLYWSSGSGTSE